MSTETPSAPLSDAAILARLIRPDDDSLSVDAAESLLRIRFDERDLGRMHDLARRNQDDRLSLVEKQEMENYRRVGYLLDLLHSKARCSLKRLELSR